MQPGQCEPQPAPRLPSVKVRAVLSVVLGLHVLAVFVGPWAMPPQGSELATSAAGLLQPYLEALSLDNGYRFFAPNPGPSHLIRYELELADGRHKEGVFPNLDEHQPRLRYHRHFMLSEFMNTVHPDPDRPAGPVGKAYIHSYARHLAHQYGARRVTLYLKRHYLPSMDDVNKGMPLGDPELYEEKLLGTFEGSQL